MNAKPTKIKLLKGTARKGRMNPAEPQPEPGTPEPPEWLAGDALDEYRRVADVLGALRCLTAADRGVLTCYALTWAELASAGRGERPLVPAMLAQFRASASSLGLDPTSRGKIVVPPAEEKESPWAQYARECK